MLWWKHKDAEIKRGTRTINTWEQFLEEFKRSFFPNNVVYEMKHKLRELKLTGSNRAYVKEFTILTLQIPQLTEDDMLFAFMDGLQNRARTELERRQIKTIDEAITQAETLTDFKHDRLDKAKGKEARGSHDKGGEDRGRGREQSAHPKKKDTPKPDGRWFERQKYSEKRMQSSKGDRCYICGGPHGYARCLEMKSLSAIVRERKEKEAQDKVKTADTTQLGMVGICDSRAEANIMTKTATEKLGLKIVPSNNRLKTVNAPPTPVCGIAHGEFFQCCHTMIDSYLQQLMVIDGEGSCMVPLVRVSKKDEYAQLSAMHIVKGLKKGAPTFLATIASSGEDYGAMEPLTPIIETVLKENSDVMPEELPKTLSPRREVDHMIELEAGAKPPALAPYLMAPPELEELRKQLKELLEADLFDRLGEAKYFTKMDLRKGYYQVRIAEGDEPKTACITRYGAFEWLVMPFGLTNAPTTFCTLMNEILHPYFDQFVVVYLDDIVVYSSTLQEHVEYLKKVFNVLRKNQLYVKREKCEFAQPKIYFLGHVISQGELRMDEPKVKAIQDWEAPTKVTELRSFVGLANYYRRFIRGYSAIAAPLTELLKKNRPWLWSEECQ
ncbi:uncharacterized protein [Solanum lycopersicum]|uniref:uncharacterized protein n=1 Tax=Solanum lycopersicum TaxID=4081 RepID=UPI000532CCE4